MTCVSGLPLWAEVRLIPSPISGQFLCAIYRGYAGGEQEDDCHSQYSTYLSGGIRHTMSNEDNTLLCRALQAKHSNTGPGEPVGLLFAA